MNKNFGSVPKEAGQSMVELALTLTIILILLAGTMDLGRALFTWIEMRDAAQEGAVYGSFCPTDSAKIEARVRDNLNPIYTYVVGIDKPSISVGSPITVNITTDLPLAVPFLSTVIGTNTITIHAKIINSIIYTTINPTICH
jgi:Flp pilus assembly protein TadG